MKIGDIVRLRSGGAKMVVTFVNSLESVVCEWHDVLGQPHSRSYRTATLIEERQ